MEWKISPHPVPYEEAIAFMEARVRDIRDHNAPEMVWLLEHPALYTAGSSSQDSDLIDPHALPVFKTGRGGQYTYHGPGQRIAYVMLDLKKRTPDVRLYVQNLENWIITTLASFGVTGFIREGRVGVWVNEQASESKIAAIGVRLHKWVTYHGISLNVNPDLRHYAGIVPCGINEYGVTSLASLGINTPMKEIDATLMRTFEMIF